MKDLVAQFRDAVKNEDAPVLIDQEGGRVARLRPPEWPITYPAASFGKLWQRDKAKAVEACFQQGKLIGAELYNMGITINCAPVLDRTCPETHEAIGDRSYSDQPDAIAELATAYAEGMKQAGVLPVIKHLPGHGRAKVDPHKQLPTVVCTEEDVLADAAPFMTMAHWPLGMSSHIVFKNIDPQKPASLSQGVIKKIIREKIGFGGFLFSDDLDMKAISGMLSDRAHQALAAGNDAVLFCNGNLQQMTEFAARMKPMTDEAYERWLHAARTRVTHPASFSTLMAQDHLDKALAEFAPAEAQG